MIGSKSELTRVVIVGGGVIGLCSAYFLATRGVEVIVLERRTIAQEASYGNGGLIVPSRCVPFVSPEMVKQATRWIRRRDSPVHISFLPSLSRFSWLLKLRHAAKSNMLLQNRRMLKAMGDASLTLFENFARLDGFDFEFQKKGLLEVFHSTQAFHEMAAHVKNLELEGYASRILDAKDAREFEPALSSEVAGAILFPNDAQANPKLFSSCLAKAVGSMKGEIKENVEVTGFDCESRFISKVKTAKGDFSCDAAVIAAGPWSSTFTKMLGVSLPIQPGKGYMVTVTPLKQPLRTAVDSAEKRVVAIQQPNGYVRIVGAMEFVGFNRNIGKRRIRWILSEADSIIPGVASARITEIWSGFRPCTPDGLPALGRVGNFENAVVATGHCRLGFTLAPITGKLVSEILLNQKTTLPVDQLDPMRFHK